MRLWTNGECCGLDGPCPPVVRILETFTPDCVEGVEPPKGGAYQVTGTSPPGVDYHACQAW